MGHNTSSAYRPDIDGMRALAVASVLVFHAFPQVLPGGFIGVDIFFVISGFLISGIILDSLANGSFSFLEFYQRRIRRIFPALAIVLAATLVAGYVMLLPDDYTSLGKHVVGGAGFVSNLVLWSEAGYFDKAAALKPLLHLWSLGIEEQFYLVWPLLLWVAWRRRWNMGMVVGGVTAASLAGCIWLTGVDATAAFYSPMTRFWELGIGAMTAIGVRSSTTSGPRPWSVDPRALAHALSLLGAALVIAGLFLLDEGQPFPGWRAAVPTLGATLLIAAGPGAVVNRSILSLRPAVWIGLISYPLYLWHWPLLSFQNITNVAETPAWMRVAALALAVCLSVATYFLLERPVRFRMRTPRVAYGLGATLAVVAAAGVGVLLMRGFVGRVPDPVARLADYRYDPTMDARAGACWLSKKEGAAAFDASCVDPDGDARPLMVLWGDSHAARLYPGLRRIAGDRYRIAQFTRDSCWPVHVPEGQVGRGYANCLEGNKYVVSRIAALKPAVVVLFAHWSGPPAMIRQHVLNTTGKLREAGVREVIVMGPAPKWRKNLPDNLIDLFRTTGTETPRYTRFGLVQTAFEIDSSLKAAIGVGNTVRYFSVLSALCNEEGCMTWVGNDPNALTSWDYGHLTNAGATYVARSLSEQLESSTGSTAHTR
jgi:peptidoglycan/LPS O-acetylase OafA/YrhL